MLNDAPILLFVFLQINNHLEIYSYLICTFLVAIALDFIKKTVEDEESTKKPNL